MKIYHKVNVWQDHNASRLSIVVVTVSLVEFPHPPLASSQKSPEIAGDPQRLILFLFTPIARRLKNVLPVLHGVRKKRERIEKKKKKKKDDSKKIKVNF